MTHTFTGTGGDEVPAMKAEYDDETNLITVTAGDTTLPPMPARLFFYLSVFGRQMMETIVNDHSAATEGPRGDEAGPPVPDEQL